LTGEAPIASETPAADSSTALQRQLFAELFASLASLLRSYTALHGLSSKREAAVEQTDDKITVIHNEKWLRLTRSHAILTWMRENGTMGTLELTESGTLRGDNSEEAMDLAAEQWARDLILNPPDSPQLEPPQLKSRK
jgi:cell division inhibitor SulA